ncbi:hypothetical protein B0T25DRAFT_238815 [Lasiosphaeria hispida]|uniref:Amidase domain-containing protein n=1 Tax=Lasiosphaeria hispida TaxID=260671 RepID=A0AAJ0HEC3_9PEZI|nr:hypothetical protein B0T25DRAFT_238815 [Lasiosphaeria hispida]
MSNNAKQPREHKTTAGLVARDNVVVTKLCGSVGPITKTVKDAAIMLNLMGRSPYDPLSTRIPVETILDYVESCKVDGLAGSRLGVPRNNTDNPFAASMNLSAVMETFDRVLDLIKGAGATIIENANYPAYPSVGSSDIPGLVGYPVIRVPLGFIPDDTAKKRNYRDISWCFAWVYKSEGS